MSEPTRVGRETESGLEELVGQVVDLLGSAGLPVSRAWQPGAQVEVDLGDDAAGGVWVYWHAATLLEDQAANCLLEGRLDDPVFERVGTIQEAMIGAVAAILTANGIAAEHSDDDLRPFALKILSGPLDGPESLSIP